MVLWQFWAAWVRSRVVMIGQGKSLLEGFEMPTWRDLGPPNDLNRIVGFGAPVSRRVEVKIFWRYCEFRSTLAWSGPGARLLSVETAEIHSHIVNQRPCPPGSRTSLAGHGWLPLPVLSSVVPRGLASKGRLSMVSGHGGQGRVSR